MGDPMRRSRSTDIVCRTPRLAAEARAADMNSMQELCLCIEMVERNSLYKKMTGRDTLSEDGNAWIDLDRVGYALLIEVASETAKKRL